MAAKHSHNSKEIIVAEEKFSQQGKISHNKKKVIAAKKILTTKKNFHDS